jgi:hypothetical protein
MPALTHLVVSNNAFTGGLDGLGLPTKKALHYVDISTNKLVSTKPAGQLSSLCALRNLTYCALASKYKTNHLSNVPDCVEQQAKCIVG